MNSKSLAFGIIGFLLGGLVVSIAATQFESQGQGTEMTMTQMNEDLAGKTGDEYDSSFLSHMIEHHEGAVEMAELASKNAKHQEVKDLAARIISAQKSEISDMKQWQADWGYTQMQHSSH